MERRPTAEATAVITPQSRLSVSFYALSGNVNGELADRGPLGVVQFDRARVEPGCDGIDSGGRGPKNGPNSIGACYFPGNSGMVRIHVRPF